jgi:hypothetical protein
VGRDSPAARTQCGDGCLMHAPARSQRSGSNYAHTHDRRRACASARENLSFALASSRRDSKHRPHVPDHASTGEGSRGERESEGDRLRGALAGDTSSDARLN